MNDQNVHVSRALGLNIKSHSEIPFADIVIGTDNEIFIDPCLIEFGKSDLAVKAKQVMSSYFDVFFNLYRTAAPDEKKLELFLHAHEINATKTGYGNGTNGKAKTPEGMLSTFRPIEKMFRTGIQLSQASDVVLFIRDFAEDCFTDMLVNVLFKILSDFTLEQCEKYGVNTLPVQGNYYYWDPISKQWQKYYGNSLFIGEQMILLLPKELVRPRYYFTVSQYFHRIILEQLKQESAWKDAQGKYQFPSKKSLDKKYRGNQNVLDCALEMTRKRPSYLTDYHKKLPSLYRIKTMTDEELDTFFYDHQ